MHVITILAMVGICRAALPHHLLKAEEKFNEALSFTSGHMANVNANKGQVHFEILRRFGLNRGSRLLEIGCGALDLASVVVPYLEVDAYVCVEPNVASVRDTLYYREGLLQQVLLKRSVFVNATDFDGREVAGQRPFDFIFSHSVLSHAAWWQLPLYIWNTNRLLSPTGISIASLYFHRPEVVNQALVENYFAGNSNDQCWVYPGISTFTYPTVLSMAERVDAFAFWDKSVREYVLSEMPTDPHDWIVFTKKTHRRGRRKLNASLITEGNIMMVATGKECGKTSGRRWLGPQQNVQACKVAVAARVECSKMFFNFATRGDNNCGCVLDDGDCLDSANWYEPATVDIYRIIEGPFKTVLGEYCPHGHDITTARGCSMAAKSLGLDWAVSWYGPTDHQYCVYADDGRNKVYFNTAGSDAASSPPKKRYASICKALANKYYGYPSDLPTEAPEHCFWQ